VPDEPLARHGTLPAELSEQQFRRWATLLESRAGITLSPQRRQFLLSNLRMRMHQSGFDSEQAYYRHVAIDPRGRREWLKLVDKLTVHETRFKRHPESFALIEQCFLASYIDADEPPRSLQAWSVGCASGEEAYTLAMLLSRYLRCHQLDTYFSVMATDISRESLAMARAARYPAARLGALDKREIGAAFTREGETFLVREELRRRVCFAEQNLMNLAQAPFGKMDIIFCQNVLIYFSQEQRRQIAESLIDFLKPGGLLVLGVGELTSWQHASLQRIEYSNTQAYKKVKN
jgi:chemotaxis methyl-accepting protein methylase